MGEKFWKKVWNANVQGKVKIYAWSACLDSLPTRLNLSNRRMMGEEMCVVCGVQVESMEHVFRDYSLARAVWFQSPAESRQWGRPNVSCAMVG